MPDIRWGEDATTANFLSRDNGGDLVLAETTDGNVLLVWNATIGQWEYGGPVDLGGNDVSNVGSMDTDSLNGTTYLHDDLSISEINTELSSAGEYVFVGDHTLTDRIDPTADTRIVVPKGSSVAFADGASPTLETSNGGGDHAPLLVADGVSCELVIRGTWDPNNTGVTNDGNGTEAAHLKNGTWARVICTGDVLDSNGGFRLVDTNIRGTYIDRVTGVTHSVLFTEGCSGYIQHVSSVGSNEVLDLNYADDGLVVGSVLGDATGDNVVESNGSQNITIGSIRGINEPDSLLFIKSNNTGGWTSETADIDSDNITVHSVAGTTKGYGIHVQNPGGTVENLTIDGIDIHTLNTSTQTGQAYAINFVANGANQFDNIRLSGRVSSDDGRGVYLNGNASNTGGQQGSVVLDVSVDATGGSWNGVTVYDFESVMGRVEARGATDDGLYVSAQTGITVSEVDLDVVLVGNGEDGVQIGGDGGTIQNVKLDGVTTDNTGSDINVQAGSVRFDGHRGTVTDPGSNLEEAQYA